MGALIITLLIVWAALSVIGVLVKGLLWLTAVGVILFAATALWGLLKPKAARD